MKRVSLLLLSFTFAALLSCSKKADHENATPSQNQASSQGQAEQIEIKAKIISLSPFRLQSNQLQERTAASKATGQQVVGYVLDSKSTSSRSAKEGNTGDPSAKEMPIGDRGYFLVGDCYRYGTLICATDDPNNCLFSECPPGMCVGFDPICPGPGGGMARQSEGSGTVILKFPKN